MDEFRDLVPRRDPKGGSPRSPTGGVPLKAYQQYSNSNGNGTIWKMLTTGTAGLLIGMTAAWWTAREQKGITNRDLQEYVKDFSPYVKDKDTIIQHNSTQDQQIGELRGGDEKITSRLNSLDVKLSVDEKDISDIQNKILLMANYLEELKKQKR